MSVGRTIIIIVLVLLLAGVAYIKALFSNQESPSEIAVATEPVVNEEFLKDYVSRDSVAMAQDSIRSHTLDSLHAFYSDSLERIEPGAAPETVDSLEKIISGLESRREADQKRMKELVTSRDRQVERLVYTFYASEMKALPRDLSEYEKKVSVREIKSKARRYFDISPERLEKIISKYKN